MIQKHAIYQKSTKGSEAIAHRSRDLLPKHRSMLILVDGKRGFDELAKLSAMLGDTEQLLGQLAAEGYIEPVAAPVAGSAAPAVAAPAQAPAAPSVTLKEAQRFAVRLLTDIMGPNAEELCLRIEAAHNVAEFNAAIARTEGLLRQFHGAAVVAGFAAEIKAHRPTA